MGPAQLWELLRREEEEEGADAQAPPTPASRLRNGGGGRWRRDGGRDDDEAAAAAAAAPGEGRSASSAVSSSREHGPKFIWRYKLLHRHAIIFSGFYLRRMPSGQVMVPVVVVVVGGNVLFEHVNDIVAQSHSNILGRSSKVRTTFSK